MARTPVESSPLERWRQEVYEAAPERTGEALSTISGIENEPLYTPDNAGVDWPTLLAGLAGAIPGGFLGARATGKIDEDPLRIALGAVLVLVGGVFAAQAVL